MICHVNTETRQCLSTFILPGIKSHWVECNRNNRNAQKVDLIRLVCLCRYESSHSHCRSRNSLGHNFWGFPAEWDDTAICYWFRPNYFHSSHKSLQRENPFKSTVSMSHFILSLTFRGETRYFQIKVKLYLCWALCTICQVPSIVL